jgi:hypothetical protein
VAGPGIWNLRILGLGSKTPVLIIIGCMFLLWAGFIFPVLYISNIFFKLPKLK